MHQINLQPVRFHIISYTGTLPQKIVHFEPPFTHFVLNLLRIIPNQRSAQTIMKHCFSAIYYTVSISRAMRKCWKISNQKSKSK
ncbi:hypothetical protein RO3G_02829 [Rhizopus delemar RA 99-880]|uniref:Uncharacterized protein n=1 Tax=Rhizopus delemar (strain RA 99-880 / ATCC MYA-4621 / FGSC 9543 / NRRL 43880) TaxID=246409 RepID=I1BPJ5_RHIO9|nr:hypothetical protein RO3G_02829 [Rhizopus delemar RA 99-880]|eukprot:EIE78125.1 hypothetical protein RO3G_02829 [Rhizopus delemar RA 99-880]